MPELSEIFAGPWGPLIIFFLRIVDVSLATIRMLLIMRGAKLAVAVIGFCEILIWIFAIGNALNNLQSLWHVIGYAGGFAAGSFVGMLIEEKLAYGFVTIRIMSKDNKRELAESLRKLGFGLTEFAGQGREGFVNLLVVVVKRRDIPRVMDEITRREPGAFVTVEDTKQVNRGWLFSKRRK